MSKRAATTESSRSHGQSFSKVPIDGLKRENVEKDEMGEFEDAWEDELESDEEPAQDEDGMDVDDDEILPAIEETEEQPVAPQVFIPGTYTLGKDETLEPDDSVYIMRHSMNVNWPCLSFDVLRDNLGDQRQRFPATAYLVAGTQADLAKNNEIVVCKITSLHRTQKDGDGSDSDDDGDEDDSDNLDEDASLEYRSIPHPGGVNRIRAQPLPGSTPVPPVTQRYHVATWAETGHVYIWDIRPHLESLDVPGYSYDKASVNTPVFTINSHRGTEGFAMDWASSGEANPSSIRLLTGDVHSKIYLTTSTPSGFNTLSQPFSSHTSSVEDLQWSPSEPTVFASCSADQSVQIWDVRTKGRRSAAGIAKAHESDVNVISWNRSTDYLLLSGGDDGGIKVWDLRNIKKPGSSAPEPVPVASFHWHRAPITSIEWHPSEDSIFAASGADDQITLWDLAVEQDDDEMGTSTTASPEADRDVPPQLLFVHQGQKDIKEIHWHAQIPGTVISTALDGFNIFKTISI